MLLFSFVCACRGISGVFWTKKSYKIKRRCIERKAKFLNTHKFRLVDSFWCLDVKQIWAHTHNCVNFFFKNFFLVIFFIIKIIITSALISYTPLLPRESTNLIDYWSWLDFVHLNKPPHTKWFLSFKIILQPVRLNNVYSCSTINRKLNFFVVLFLFLINFNCFSYVILCVWYDHFIDKKK